MLGKMRSALHTRVCAPTSDRLGDSCSVSPCHAMCTGRSLTTWVAHDRFQMIGNSSLCVFITAVPSLLDRTGIAGRLQPNKSGRASAK
jgi:hypothetical protein